MEYERGHPELTESANEPTRLECAPRAAEEADGLGLWLVDVHQLPCQPAQTPLGPVPAQRGLQAPALRPRAVSAAIQPQRAPALHKRHAGLQVRPEGLLRDRCPGETRAQPGGATLAEILAPLCRVRCSRGTSRGPHPRQNPGVPRPAQASGLEALSKSRGCIRDMATVSPGLQGSDKVVGEHGGRGETRGSMGSSMHTATVGGRDSKWGDGEQTASQAPGR